MFLIDLAQTLLEFAFRKIDIEINLKNKNNRTSKMKRLFSYSFKQGPCMTKKTLQKYKIRNC